MPRPALSINTISQLIHIDRLAGPVRLPGIVRATDLAVVMPRNIARGFAREGGYAIVEPEFPLRDFTVSLHWSRRFEAEPGNQWLRQLILAIPYD